MPRSQRKVGSVYGTYKGRPMYHYKCCLFDDPSYDGIRNGCCHWRCRINMLREKGHNDIADRLEANLKAKDWLNNWGKMVYDPRQHGKDPQRRRVAAQIIKGIRNQSCNEGQASIAGAWIGSVM